jgi:hypothetical protein
VPEAPEYRFLVLGILHNVQGKFPDDVSGAAVDPIFNGHKLELQLMTIGVLRRTPTQPMPQ